jgi:hypothetical protein
MNRSFDDHLGVVCLFAAISLSIVTSLAFGIGSVSASTIAQPRPAATPAYTGYKGVKIGMSDEDARKLLGTPKEKGDGQDYYVYSDNESAQVQYDGGHKVVTVSVTYIGKSSSIPTPKAIFGDDVEAKPDGSIFKQIRYPKDGITISYNKTGGDDPLVMITVQKIFGGSED